MSRTIKGSKSPGFDYWKSRYTKLTSPGRYTKFKTHKQERRNSKVKLLNEYWKY